MKRSAWIILLYTLLLLLLQLPAFATATAESRFRSFNLCNYFGGRCGRACNTYYRHKWGIPLCPDQIPICCAPEQNEPVAPQRQAPSPPTSTPSTSLSITSTTTLITTGTTSTTTSTPSTKETAEPVIATDKIRILSTLLTTDVPHENDVTKQPTTHDIRFWTTDKSTSHITRKGNDNHTSSIARHSSHITTSSPQIDVTSAITIPTPSSAATTISLNTSEQTGPSHSDSQKHKTPHQSNTTGKVEGAHGESKQEIHDADDSPRLVATDYNGMVNDDAAQPHQTTRSASTIATKTVIVTANVRPVTTTYQAITVSPLATADVAQDNVMRELTTEDIHLFTEDSADNHMTVNAREAQLSTVDSYSDYTTKHMRVNPHRDSYSDHSTIDMRVNPGRDDISATPILSPTSLAPTVSVSTLPETGQEMQHRRNSTAERGEGADGIVMHGELKTSIKQAAPYLDDIDNDDAVLRCGIRSDTAGKKKPRRKRIVGGRITKPGIWPWQVSVRSAIGMSACSGVLIAPGWVLTAAHCFKFFPDPSFWRIRVGEYDLAQSDRSETDHRLRRIFKHPDYVDSSDAAGDGDDKLQQAKLQYVRDIALVQLENDVSFGKPCCSAICLTSQVKAPDPRFLFSRYYGIPPKPRDIDVFTENGDCWVTGWGRNKDNWTTTRLQEVRGTVLTSDQCATLWQRHIPEDMLCFGDGSYGPCMGDSGGPLMCRHEKSAQFYVVGVVSWGTEQCGRQGYPSVFTRVASYIPWVTSVITQAEALDSKLKRGF